MCSRGKLKAQSPPDSTCRSSCVKLYLCSNPQDSVLERKALRESVFPKLREHCRDTWGLDLRVIDPFESSDPCCWPDECTRQQLIKECRESSAGPYLLALVGHQYGTASLPVQVDVPEYELLLQQSQQAGVSTRVMERFYQRDENTIPPSYCLRLPHTRTCSPRSEINKEEQNKLKATEEELKKVFQTSVSLCVHNGLMSPEKALTYYRSALDTDLRFALDAPPDKDIIRRCLVYIHRVVSAETERERGQAATSNPRTAPTDGQLLSELCDKFLPGLVTSCQHLVYTTTTQCDCRYGYTTSRRWGYANSLCQQVYSDIVGLLDSVNTLETVNQTQPVYSLSREQAEQEELCDTLSQLYDVIQPQEEEIRAYVEQSDQQCPLVVLGGPCTGKTVLLAHSAQQIKSWLPDSDPVVITYFCNLEPLFSPSHLLSSLCYQIAKRYHSDSPLKSGLSFNRGTDPDNLRCITDPKDDNSSDNTTSILDSHDEPSTTASVFDANLNLCTMQCPHCYTGIQKPDMTLSELKKHFFFLVSQLPSTKKPLILNLDGLDQIENNIVCSQVIESLPSPLPPGIRLILTVSSSRTQVLEAIKQHYPQSCPPHLVSEGEGSERNMGCVCVQLGLADRKECVNLLASLLRSSGRRVTSGQQALVNRAMTSCCLTLYARLLHVHTSLWYSDSDVTASTLPSGIHASLSALLDHLEQKHGSSLVARAVSYLTLSRTGLTEVELADFLSVRDGVQSVHILQGESRSSRMRVLQIDVERLLLDLQHFLIRRTFMRSCVLLWMTRHLKLVVAKRYLGTQEARREIHSELADYFSGQQACDNADPLVFGQKSGPSTESLQKKIYENRQPFMFTCSSTHAGQMKLRKVIELPYHLQQSGRWEELERGLLMSLGFHQAMVQGGLLEELVNMLQSDKLQFQFLRERQLLAGTLKSSAYFLQHVPLQLPTVMETSLLPYLEVFPALKAYVREIREERRKRGHGLKVVLSPAPSSVPPLQHLKSDISVAQAAGTECGIVVQITDNGSAWIWKGSGCDVAKLSLNCEQKDLKFMGVKSSGRFLLFSTHCNKVFLWDVTGPEKLQEVKDLLKPESETPNKITGFVECQKKIFMWWEDEHFLSVFDVSSKTLTRVQCQTSVTCLVCSSHDFYMYCGQEDGTISIYDTDSCCLLSSSTNSNHSAVKCIIVSEEKREVACVGRTGNVTLWGVATKTKPPRLVKERLTEGETSNVLNHDFSEEIKMCLVCQSHQVSLWDTCDWELWDQFLAPQGRAFTQAVLSQGGHLFCAVLDTCSLVLVWKVSKGECVLSLETSQQPHALFKTASDLICVTHDGCLTVWDSDMIDAAGTAPKTGCGVKEVVVEDNAEHFYTTDGSEAVWRWTLEAGFPHANFLHEGPVEKLCLSPDNTHLLTLSVGDIYTWQTETGQNILRISGSRATDILITPNNKFGVSISKQGLSHVWNLVNGSIVCSIHLHLSNAKVSPESTFLLGCHQGDLLAASLWSGSISKRFSCVESSDHVVAFHPLSEQPDFVVVMTASGAVYTWKVAEETVCKHFQLPCMFQCQPQDFQMSSDGSYALLSTVNNTVNLLDLSQVRLRSFKAEGPVVKACMDQCGCLTAYISWEKICDYELHTRPVLTVIRMADGERVGSLWLPKNPLSLVVCKQQCVYVGFEDGSVGVYSVSGVVINREESVRCREKLTGELKQCPCDRVSFSWLPLATPNVIWP